MHIQEYISLKPYTTFMTEALARYFIVIDSIDELISLVNSKYWQYNPYILGSGSNILFTKDYDGLIVVNNIKGKNILNQTDEYIDIEFFSGESWHECVLWSVDNNYWGIENLILIPGTIGASAVQNIGAYGVEAADSIRSVKVINTENSAIETITHDTCNFGYRDSIFKQLPKKYIIVSVTYRLSKKPQPHIHYGSIQSALEKNHITEPNLQQIGNTIIDIRRSKLPDVGSIGMAGSFFKNPIIHKSHFNILEKKYPKLPYYQLDDNKIKIPAGWIIEILGYKGYREGNIGTYHEHALVLVNYGGAHGSEIWEFAQKIMSESLTLLNIKLEPEVIIL